MWQFTGYRRPAFAHRPGPGQESVWDYPRPPDVVPDGRIVEVRVGARPVARTDAALRVLETASPPTFYLPADCVCFDDLIPVSGQSFCEWKGVARYWGLASRLDSGIVAWAYPAPTKRFARIAGYVSFYPGKVECFVDGEPVRAQPGEFYGGWVTDDVVGPFKGEPGTGGW